MNGYMENLAILNIVVPSLCMLTLFLERYIDETMYLLLFLVFIGELGVNLDPNVAKILKYVDD